MENRRIEPGQIWGLVVAGLGVLLLLGNFNLMLGFGNLFATLLFLGGAAAFLAVYLNNRQNWWALFPAGGLGAIGVTIASHWLFPGIGNIAGFLFFAVIAAAFAGVYVNNREQYWPIIPAGVCATLALTTLTHGGAIFFGLAATFGLVYVLSGEGYQRASWAIYPAGALAGVGLIIALAGFGRFLFPLILIGLGVALIYERSRRHP